jgi:hypothetical protein
MEKALEVLEPIKREVISRLYGIDVSSTQNSQNPLLTLVENQTQQPKALVPITSANKSSAETKTPPEKNMPNDVEESNSLLSRPPKHLPSYSEIAQLLSEQGNPKDILKYANNHQNNLLVFDETDIKELEQQALRELARGNRVRYGTKK